jgi:hypothetical protein
MIGVTVDREGTIVSGSPTQARRFSEYWIFMRVKGHDGSLQTSLSKCPNCAADLKINRSGVCEYCTSKVGNGDFGWVLSRITQDEEYRGVGFARDGS